jgi:hypothetical protein
VCGVLVRLYPCVAQPTHNDKIVKHTPFAYPIFLAMHYISIPWASNLPDEYVMAIEDFDHFTAKMYLDEASITYPPPGGWPDIIPDTMHALHKMDQVIDILRHLPYIRSNDGIILVLSEPQRCTADWDAITQQIKDGADAATYLSLTEGFRDEFGGKVPDDCLALTTCGRGSWIMDAQEGLIYWIGMSRRCAR